jgi:pimeloyl-ACP methyl ester carboxylesterase
VTRRRTVAGLVTGGALAAVTGAGYLLHRTAIVRWRVTEDEMAASARALPGDLEHHMVDVGDGGRIHVVERGAGPPIVLVHGVTLGVATWAPQLHHLADRHRVLAVGQRGHGRSVAGHDGYSLERLAEDLAEVLEACRVGGAVLVGHSMGGMVSQLLALEHPEAFHRHVAGLALVATAAGPLVPGPGGLTLAGTLALGAGKGLRYAERTGRGLFPVEDLAVWASRAAFGARPDPLDVELTRSMIAAMAPASMAGLLGPLLRFDVSGRVGGIDVPTKVVVGRRDLLTPPRMARALARAIPGAELTEYPGCGHMVMLERPDELDRLLDEFSLALAAG